MTPTFKTCDQVGDHGVALVRKLIAHTGGTSHSVKDVVNTAWKTYLEKWSWDLLIEQPNRKPLTAEVKTETNDYPNFFFETWSNRKYRIQTPGWMVTCRADRFFYVFLARSEIYMWYPEQVFEWFWGTPGVYRMGEKFPEKVQSANPQQNRTTGVCVPIEEVRKGVELFCWTYENDGEAFAKKPFNPKDK